MPAFTGHTTGQADLPHPALGQDFTPSLSRATPSAVSEHSSELIGCPISRSFTTYCVCLELRSLPSTGITRLQRYYKPLRHPKAPGLSLTDHPRWLFQSAPKSANDTPPSAHRDLRLMNCKPHLVQ